MKQQFWGASVANSPMEQARQIWLNAQAKMILSGEIKMAKKVKSVEEVVDRAVQGMAEQDTVDRVLALKPGLHVRRTQVLPDGNFVYSTVRVIGCDRGDGMEYKIFTLNHIDGCEELELTQFEIDTSYFMEIKE